MLDPGSPRRGDVAVRLHEVRKRYSSGEASVEALRGISFEIAYGEYVCIMGPSGCGKSTLLNILGCLDRPTEGRYELGGIDVSSMDDDALSSVRGRQLGFVFQSYNLIPQLSVVENIEVPLFYQGMDPNESAARAAELAGMVGLGERLHHKPPQLSGGQQQRAGIARALASDPVVILADEPTGNLDSSSGGDILAMFRNLHEQGRTLILVTHDEAISEQADRTLRLRDGMLERDERRSRAA